MQKLKMGIIGAGGIAQDRHIPAYQALSDKVEITAIQDLKITKAKEVAEKFTIPNVFTDYEELFEVVDAVTICTPNKFHAEISIAALEAGVHVLCEKPMAITTGECDLMIEAAKKADKCLSIAYHYRFLESVQLAKQTMKEIGDPLVTRVQALRRRKVPGWGVFTNKELQGGGSLIDWGCHFLDTALWLLDEPTAVEVAGTTYNILSKTPNQLNEWGTFDHESFEVDDHVSSYIRFENGASMLFECSWAANIKEDTTNVSISGSTGGLSVFPFEFYQPKHGAFLTTQAKVEEDQEKAGLLQAKNFIESCLGEAELVNKPEQARTVTKIIEAIYKSSEIQSSIKLI
ncbi:Gfo/Idh/MocA family protein [Oceanobacillus alkalisoli]|uniref:Gfo/Idh/MocA family protein n=1 Tax=Oceanobacillus alkalisoli TaxID=2925113 RepID=UPI001EEFE368|nr:Gfo/Idh/MocA family oxidoreductase [Oceanobacillus alkalisoli]MCF3945002.1 Gfo/Idh/MocA family oxidoreductase [Oceanobacillus alkalisoli]MCG5103950.1 Gfo/Idh/MocA family oxidoreductase [Oceanobacillus alkalisoli]